MRKRRGFIEKAILASCGIIALIAGACTPEQPSQGSGSMSVRAAMKAVPPAWPDVAPIFKSNCIGCHSGGSAAAGLNLSSYAGVKKGGSSGPAIKLRDAKASLLMKRVHGTIKPQMPLGGDPLPQALRSKLEEWINAGAPEKGATTAAKPGEKRPAEPVRELEPEIKFPKPGEQVLYRHVQRIFAQRCVKCHIDGGQMGRAPEGFRLDSYQNALNTGERANLIPGNPNASKVVRLIKGIEQPRMPFNESPLTSDEIRVITDWIWQGARDNSGNVGPMPVGVQVRFEGTLDSYWTMDGIVLDARGARIDKSPRIGGYVEVRGFVDSNGKIRATRIRRR